MSKKAPTRRQTPGRRAPEFTVPIKLWVAPDMYQGCAAEAERRDWSVPQVIRYFVREALSRGNGGSR